MDIQNQQIIQCEIILRSYSPHLSQIFTGIGLLEKLGFVAVKIIEAPDYDPGVPQRLKLVLNNERKLVFDYRDAKTLHPDDLEWSDFYFKRSFHRDHLNHPKVRPVGPFYWAYGSQDYSRKTLIYNLKFALKNYRNYRLWIVSLKNIMKGFATGQNFR